MGQLYGIDHERLFDHAERLLRLFELLQLGDSPLRTYSAGQQKKVALCSVLVTETPILRLDEPFSGGLDPSVHVRYGGELWRTAGALVRMS